MSVKSLKEVQVLPSTSLSFVGFGKDEQRTWHKEEDALAEALQNWEKIVGTIK